MKIGVEYRGKESLVVDNYKDIFEQYNDDVNNLVIKSVSMLNSSKRRLDAINLTVSSIKRDIDSTEQSIKELEGEVSKRNEDKERGIVDLVEKIKQQRISEACAYKPAEIEDVVDKYNFANKESVDGVPESPTYESMLEDAGTSLKFDIEKRDALAGIMNDVGKNFELSRIKDNEWCQGFNNLYNEIDDKVQSMDEYELIRVGRLEDTTDKLLNDYDRKYGRISVRSIYDKILWLFCLPMAIISRRNNFIPPSITGFAGSMVGSFMNSDTRVVTSLSLVALLIEYFVFMFEPIIGVTAVIVFISMIFGIKYQKKNINEYASKIIMSYLYYNHITSEIEDVVKSQYDRFVEKYRDDMRKDADVYSKQLSMMQSKNKEVKERVANEFDPNSVDKTSLISEFNRQMNSLHDNIDKLNSKKDSLETKLTQVIDRQKTVKSEYDKVVGNVKDMFTNGCDCNTYNGMKNKDGVVRRFIYLVSYCNIFTILNGVHIQNVFGVPANGVNPSNPAITKNDLIGGIGDLAPKTIPIRFKMLDIKDIVKSLGADQVIASVLQDIIDSVSDEFHQHMKNYKEYRNTQDLDLFDTRNLYVLDLAEHNYKCSLFLYNSNEDNNHVFTISRLIYERFFKATYLTSNPKAFRHHFMVKDTNYFNDGNIATLSKSAGVSNDVIVDMMKTNVYDIVEKDKYSDLLKKVKSQGEEFRDKVAELSSGNMLEYIVKCKSKGSSPYMCDYLYLWNDIEVLKNDTLISILHETGGSKSAGVETSSENKVGIIPFIFIDVAGLYADKLDKQFLTGLRDIVESVAYDKFFEVGAGALSLTKMDRHVLLDKIDSALRKEENKNL